MKYSIYYYILTLNAFKLFSYISQDEIIEKPLWLTDRNGEHHFEQYLVQKQCVPHYDYVLQYFYRIAFRLYKYQYCGGRGMLICYVGQLGDEINSQVSYGQISSIPYRLINFDNNDIAANCDRMRNLKRKFCSKKDKKCLKWTTDSTLINSTNKTFGKYSWHGIGLKTDNSGNLLIKLSTSNRTFILHRNKFTEWAILKLSSPYSSHWGSFFSTSFGPARDFGSIDDSKEWLEEQFKISIKEDVDVRKEYMKLISKGAYLSNYAGIWSIGLDLLPLVTENKVSFFIWKDKCCELEAWFLSPTVEKPNVESKEEKEKREAKIHLHNKIPINRPIRISDGMLMSIRGYIKLKAKQVFIQLENRYPFYKKLEAIRWTANWANETNPEFHLESLIASF